MVVSQETPITYATACDLFPGGVNSPVRACLSVGVTPPVLVGAYADSFLDSEGRTFLDYCCSWGSLIHGHHHPEIYRVIQEDARKGVSYGLTSENEILFASYLLSALEVPHHKIRFMSSGMEATMTAVRLACGVTNRNICIKFSGCYHGHADVFLHSLIIREEHLDHLEEMIAENDTQRSTIMLSLPYNDPALLSQVMERMGERVAGIIFEPICANMGLVMPTQEFLDAIFSMCHRYQCLSIMDEVVTGFRCGFQGVRALFQVTPDIVVYGKIIGGGLPVSALVAPAAIMDHLAPLGPVFQAGTLSGNPLAMAAGHMSTQLCHQEGFYERLEDLTKVLCEPVEDAIQTLGLPVCCVRQGSMFSLFFASQVPQNLEDVQATDQEAFRRFYQELFARGIYLSPSPFEANFISSVHLVRNLQYTGDVLIDVLKTFSFDI